MVRLVKGSTRTGNANVKGKAVKMPGVTSDISAGTYRTGKAPGTSRGNGQGASSAKGNNGNQG